MIALSGLMLTASRAEESKRPNVILFVADDLGYGETGIQGNTEIPTPHIDAIAANGVRFTSGYVTAPFCSASRAGLLTGKYQTRFGYEFNPVGARNEEPGAGLPPGEKTLADYLRDDAGYATALIGKWHLGGTAPYFPLRRGFDRFFGFLHEGHYFVPAPYDGVTTLLRRKTLPGGRKGRWQSEDRRTILTTHMRHNEPDYDADNPIYRDGQPAAEADYLTDALTREAVDFIERNKERPFFLYLAYNAVHSPMQGADAWMEKFMHIDDIHRRIFAAMLGNLDASVGQVTQALRKADLDENTLIFFLSDNGGPTRELTSSNAPLRGGKGTVYEGGVRVPFLMQWKGKIPAGIEYRKPVVSLDIFSTACAAAGIESTGERDGVDLFPFVKGENDTAPHPSLFWRTGDRKALRSGDWKITSHRDSEWELFDLEHDLGESTDLARDPAHAARLRKLATQWNELNKEMIDPIWRPR